MMTLSNPAAAPDRLDDYRVLDILDRESARPLRSVAHDAAPAVKAAAVRASLEVLHAVARRHPRVVHLVTASANPDSP